MIVSPPPNLCSALGIIKMKEFIKKLQLQLQILQLQLQVLLLKRRLTVPNLPNPRFIIIHHEGGNAGFANVNEWHRQVWNFRSSLGFYCGYQLYLSKGGNWFRARSDFEEGAHCPGHNKDSVGICVQGDYSPGKDVLAPELNYKLINKVDELRLKYGIPKSNVLGDKEGRVPSRPTACPMGLMEWVIKYR